MSDALIFPDEFLPNIQTANKTNYTQWKQSNPKEAAKWEKFRDTILQGTYMAPPVLATKYGKALVAAGKLHMSVTDIGSAPVTPPVDPTWPGVLRGNFTDFYTTWESGPSDHNGEIFKNRWKSTTVDALQTRFWTPQTPWSTSTIPDGSAIAEVSTANGPGFRMVCNPEMVNQLSGPYAKKVEIVEYYGNAYGAAMFRGAPYTDEVSFYIRFPQSGNPNGFPPGYDGFNVWWQNSIDDIPSGGRINGFGINTSNTFNGPNTFYATVLSNSFYATDNTPRWLARSDTTWQVQFDVDYHFRIYVKWTYQSDGFYKVWIKRPQDPAEVLFLDYSGPTFGNWRAGDTPFNAHPNVEFGFYSAITLNNEVVFSDLRVNPH